MPRRKDPSEWSPAYRQRVERYLAKHPYATLTEATGRKHKAPPPTASNLELSQHQLRKLQNNLQLKSDLGMVNKEKAQEGLQAFKQMQRGIKKMYEKAPPGTRAYYQYEEKIRGLYWDLVAEDLIPTDAPEGVIYYH